MKHISIICLFLFYGQICDAQQAVGSVNPMHIGPDAQIAFFGNMTINGALSSQKNTGATPQIFFLGTTWENNQSTADLRPNPTSDPGGEFIFIGNTSQEIRGGSTAFSDSLSFFPNLTLNNNNGVEISGNEGCRNNFRFIAGKMVLDTFNFVMGTIASKGNITGYSPNAYFVTSNGSQQSNNGFLVRYSDNQNTDFPIGTNTSYDPARVKINAGNFQQMKIRVFPGTGQTGYGTMDITAESCGKTWDITPTGTAPTAEITLAHDKSQEGIYYNSLPNEGFITHYVGISPNTAGGETSYSNWDRLPASDPNVGPGINANITDGPALTTHAQHTRIINSFSPFSKGVQSDATPLPVTLLYFNVERENRNSLLTWSTVTEINNAGFFVEHSLDAVNFSDLDFVSGAGNSNQVLQYDYTHINPGNGIHYYRLRQTDYNGDIEYSPIRSVIFSDENEDGISVFPNPNTGIFYITSSQELGNYRLYDASGKTIQQGILTSDNASLDITPFSAGIYYLAVQETVIKIIKQ